MIPAFSPFLALRYLLRRPIMLIGVCGVTFAVWALLVVDGIFTGFVTEIRADVRRSTADLLVTDLPHDTSYELLRPALETDDAVAATAPRLRHHGIVRARQIRRLNSREGVETSAVNFEEMTLESGFALLLGIDPLREPAVTPIESWLERGTDVLAARGVHSVPTENVFDEPDPTRRAMMLLPDEVEWDTRAKLHLQRPPRPEDHRSEWPGMLVGWWRIPNIPPLEGYPIDLMTASMRVDADGSSRILTRRATLALAGYFATSHRQFDQTAVILPIEKLRTLLGHDIESDRSIDIVTDVAIRLAPGAAATTAVKQRLQQAVQALLPPGSAACAVIDWEEQNSVFLRAIAQEHSMMQFVLFVVMVVAAFVIYATLHMMVVQKWKDIGILAAIGGTPRGIGTVFVFCGLVVGGVGALLGSVTGWLSVHYLNDFNDWLYATTGASLFPRTLFDLPIIPVHLEVRWIVEVALGALLLALLVAALPARKAARMEPVTALSYE
ncbi:MAG: FtsX-like permease family protein [Planctomycetes bacterium]|nr:FtsX-like permease family protein [Planctomycetota bacterium]